MAIVSSVDQVLAFDIGATSIKMADVSFAGDVRGAIRRRNTPYPCTPERLTQWLVDRIEHRHATYVGIGFPGQFSNGIVLAPGNLARHGGAGTPVVPAIAAQWQGFALTRALQQATLADVRVVNDARMAAMGSLRGQGRELVLTLGTGFGVSLAIDGVFQDIEDFGQQVFDHHRTYDQAMGEQARAADVARWKQSVAQVVAQLRERWHVDHVHVGGGNAQRLRTTDITPNGQAVTIQGNRAALRGAAYLFQYDR